MSNAPEAAPRRRARRIAGRLLDRVADPQRERPILKAIFERVVPLLIDFFMQKLPVWLASFDCEDDPDTKV